LISPLHNLLALIQHCPSPSEMNIGWRQKSDTAVVMFVVAK
jgi:hypothetical protein